MSTSSNVIVHIPGSLHYLYVIYALRRLGYNVIVKNSSNKVLKVKYPTTLSNFGSSRIYFKKDGITSYYLYSRWSDSFSKILYKNLLENLEDAKIFKSVQ